jgi:hypothetical protein
LSKPEFKDYDKTQDFRKFVRKFVNNKKIKRSEHASNTLSELSHSVKDSNLDEEEKQSTMQTYTA